MNLYIFGYYHLIIIIVSNINGAVLFIINLIIERQLYRAHVD